MKKKQPKEEPKAKDGWTFISSVACVCHKCGKFSGFDNDKYWRRIGENTELRCGPCVGRSADRVPKGQ